MEFAAAGAHVVVHGGTDAQALEEAARAVHDTGSQCVPILADLTSQQGREKLLDEAYRVGDVDVWVNNAGVDVLTGPAAERPFDEKLDSLIAVDVVATVLLSRAVGARMKARGRGVLLNMGWDQAESGMGGDSGEMFAAVKGAVAAFSRSLARSLAPEVRVNCLAPGWIQTAWGREASDYWQQRAVEESLLRRWGDPADVAHLARFLASPAGGFITGQVIQVNGGRAR